MALAVTEPPVASSKEHVPTELSAALRTEAASLDEQGLALQVQASQLLRSAPNRPRREWEPVFDAGCDLRAAAQRLRALLT
ncbi:MAG: hypothetical protein ACRDHY_19295 [Anaerolineales bacterium]